MSEAKNESSANGANLKRLVMWPPFARMFFIYCCCPDRFINDIALIDSEMKAAEAYRKQAMLRDKHDRDMFRHRIKQAKAIHRKDT